MRKQEYNGYYNYNVWNVMLYINNEYDIYKEMMDLFSDYYNKKITNKQFNRGINRIGRAAHMRSDIRNEKLTKTEMEEIRKVIRQDYRETKKYWEQEKSSPLKYSRF